MSFSQYKNNKQFTLPSVERLFTDINNRTAPFNIINAEGQLHVMPVKKGLFIAIPKETDALYRVSREDALQEKENRKYTGPNGEILYAKAPPKPHGNYNASWLLPWVQVKKYISEIQNDAIQFFNLLSVETRSANFGRLSRSEFDQMNTATLTRQLRFLCAAMGSLGARPPLVVYSFALEILPPQIYRLGVAYQPGDINSYKTIDPTQLFEYSLIAPDVEAIISMRYLNYADTSFMPTGGSLLITKPFLRDSTHASEASTYEAVLL